LPRRPQPHRAPEEFTSCAGVRASVALKSRVWRS
jgi:hypothetical protein